MANWYARSRSSSRALIAAAPGGRQKPVEQLARVGCNAGELALAAQGWRSG